MAWLQTIALLIPTIYLKHLKTYAMKILQLTAIAVSIIFAGCSKQEIVQPQTTTAAAQTVSNAPTTHFIGEHFGGGIVFYVSNNGLHGLIADSTDLKAATWYNGTYTITGVTATNIGSGKGNTRLIIQDQGTPGKYAANLCAKSKRGGFTDWYLPSRDELSQMYLERDVIGNFVLSNYYWSSSEIHDSSVFSWGVYFFSGVQYANPKNYIGNVRAIRAF